MIGSRANFIPTVPDSTNLAVAELHTPIRTLSIA